MSKPKRHHYVPEWYLNCFSDDGQLWVHDKQTHEYRQQRPKQVMVVGRYYEQAWAPAGVDPNILERGFSVSESKARQAFKRLLTSPHDLNDHDSAEMLVFVEFQRIRVPRQAESGKALIHNCILSTASPEIVRELQSGKFRLTIKDSARFDIMKVLTGKLHPWFGRMEWEVIEAAGNCSFLTTDSPVTFFNPDFPPPMEAGIGLVGTLVLYPLSSNRLLVMRHPERDNAGRENMSRPLPEPAYEDRQIKIVFGRVFDAGEMQTHNALMAELAHRFIVAKDRETLVQATLGARC